MDRSKLTGNIAKRLVSEGADRESAVREAVMFVDSLSDTEASKIEALSGNEAAMGQITRLLLGKIKSTPKAQAVNGQAFNSVVKGDIVSDDGDADGDDNLSAMLSGPRQRRVPKRTEAKPHAARNIAPSGRAEQPQKQAQQIQPQQIQPQQIQQPQQQIQMQQQQIVPAKPVQPQQRQTQPQSRPRPAGQGAQQAARPNTDKNTDRSRPLQPHPVQRKAVQGRSKPEEKKIIHKPDPNADYRKFYIILACSSPLWIFAALLGMILFMSVLGGLCLAIVFLIGALILGVAGGTVISLVGIIYGITQLFQYVPIGLYEIGLGVMIGGIVMFGGIIAYNVAVRLLPYLIKKVIALLSYAMRRCVELYYYAKGACADL